MTRKLWIALAAVVALAVLLFYWRREVLEVEVTRATTGTVRETITEDGKTHLDREYLIDMPISGRLRRIGLKEGDTVRKGQVIAQADDYGLRQQLTGQESRVREIEALIRGVDVSKPKPQDIESARLKVSEARLALEQVQQQRRIAATNLAQLKREYERQADLLRQGVSPRSLFDEAERAYKNAIEGDRQARIQVGIAREGLRLAELAEQRIRASVNDNEFQRHAYQAQLRQIQSQINVSRDEWRKSAIRSPVSGLVLEVFVKDDRLLPAGTPLLKIGDPESLVIEADVLSEEIPRLRVGQPVEISGKALGDRPVRSRVARIYPSGFTKISALGIEQQRVKVIVAFDNGRLALLPGTSVDLKIITAERRNVTVVPERAVFKDGGRWQVFVVEDGQARLRPVTVGLRNDDWAEIRGGLAEGEEVISELSNKLRPGIRVRPLKAPGRSPP